MIAKDTTLNNSLTKESPDKKSKINEDKVENDDKQTEIYSLQERIRKLESDISLLLADRNISNDVDKEDVDESKDTIEGCMKNIGKPPRIVRNNSVQFVSYRSFSPSFETNLRQRARGSSIGNENDGDNDVALIVEEKDKVEEQIAEPTQHDGLKPTPSLQKQESLEDASRPTSTSNDVLEPTANVKTSLLEYLKVEILGEGQQHPRVSTRVAQETDAVMQDFLYVPMKLEKLLFYGLSICVDSYLYVLTYLPIRVLWSILLLLCYPFKSNTFRFHRRHLFHLQHMGIIIFVYWYVLQPISISMLYHWIRGQNMLKLYVLMAMVEVFDRLMSSFGQDALDSMYWNTTSRPFHLRTLLATLVVIGYASAHSFILFVHVATLNVAMNSADNALLTVLMSNNFAEIKSTVFKKYNKTNLFKITTSDVCERFKLTLFLFLIVLLNYSQGGYTLSMFYDFIHQCSMVFSAELLSDWIKHCFITKFNFIKSGVYEDYELILAGDVTGIGHEMWNIDHTHAVIKRVGLSQIPCACVMIRFVREAMRYWSLNQEMCVVWSRSFFDLFCVLFGIKVILGFIICRISQSIIDHAPEKEHVAVENDGAAKNKKQAVV